MKNTVQKLGLFLAALVLTVASAHADTGAMPDPAAFVTTLNGAVISVAGIVGTIGFGIVTYNVVMRFASKAGSKKL